MWSQKEIEQTLETQGSRALPATITDVTFNSKACHSSALFVALPPHPTNHGGLYIPDAQKKGAAILWDPTSPIKPDNSTPSFQVPCARQGLLTLARKKLSAKNFSLTLITGSHGKTSTKDIYAHLTSNSIFASPANKSTVISNCSHLASMPSHIKHAVLEVGISRLGEMDEFVKLFAPYADCAIITNIAPTHLEFLKSTDNVLEEKTKIWQALSTKGLAVFEGDREYSPQLQSKVPTHAKFLTFGQNKSADATILSYALTQRNQAEILVRLLHHNMTITTQMTGEHMARNITAAALSSHVITHTLPTDIQKQAATLNFSHGRGQRVPTPYGLIVDCSYNAASPSGVTPNITSLFQLKQKTSIIILSELAEQSSHKSKHAHQGLIDYITEHNPEAHIVLIGQQWHDLTYPHPTKVHICNTQTELIETTEKLITQSTAILVQGSRAANLSPIIPQLQHKIPLQDPF